MTSAIWGLAMAVLILGVLITMANARLIASVAALTSVIASTTTLIEGMAGRIRDAAGDEDASNALADELDQDSAELAAAVTANTPADTTGGQVPGAGTQTDSGATDTTAPPSADSSGAGGVGQGPETDAPPPANPDQPVDQGAGGTERVPDSLDQNAQAQEAAGQNPEGGFGESDQQTDQPS